MATESIRTEGVRHEPRDASIPALGAFGAAIVLSIAVVMIFSLLLFKFYTRALPTGPPATPFASSRPLPPEPRLQPTPRLDLNIYLDDQQSELSSYGWVDRPNGVVRIPIERAMQLLLKQGLPVRAASQLASSNGLDKMRRHAETNQRARGEVAARRATAPSQPRIPGRQ